jgi:hypothetical protein
MARGHCWAEPRDRGQYLLTPFSQRLAEFGYKQGRNVDLTVHYTEARIEKFAELLGPLVVNIDLLLLDHDRLIAAKKSCSSALPAIFLGVGDPVRIGRFRAFRTLEET